MAVIVETLMAEDLELGVGDTTKTHPAGGSLNGHQISISTLSLAGAAGLAATKTWDLSAGIGIGSQAFTTIEVPGAEKGDMVLASYKGIGTSALVMSAHVSDVNTVTVVLSNMTSALVTPAIDTLAVLVFKHR